MKYFCFGLALCASLWVQAQRIQTIKLADLEKLMTASTELKAINFWASWCGPCVQEMPYFQELDQGPGVQVILVSLDFPKDLEKATRILEKKGITATCYLLDERDYDSFIPKVDKKWSGAIPATLFIRPDGKKFFYESAFEKTELDKIVNQLKQ